jgi:hypothetical protein
MSLAFTLDGHLVRAVVSTLIDKTIGSSAEATYHRYLVDQKQERYGVVNIVGNELFQHIVQSALRRLENNDTYGYGLIQRYLRGIVATEKPLGLGYLIGVRFEQADRAGVIRWTPCKFAAILVRYAIWIRLYRGFGICPSRSCRAQLLALRRELRVMKSLDAPPREIQQLTEYIEEFSRQARVV